MDGWTRGAMLVAAGALGVAVARRRARDELTCATPSRSSPAAREAWDCSSRASSRGRARAS